jgi:hypothetical protein
MVSGHDVTAATAAAAASGQTVTRKVGPEFRESVGGSASTAAGGDSCVAELYAIARATGLLDMAAGAIGRAIGIPTDQVLAAANATATHAGVTLETSMGIRAPMRPPVEDKENGKEARDFKAAMAGLASSVNAIAKRHDQLVSEVEILRTQLAEQQKTSAAQAATMTRLDSPATARDKFLIALPQLARTHVACIWPRDTIPFCCRPCCFFL